jgi:hypothetical protein
MAFQRNTSSQTNAQNTDNGGWEKAQGFINIYLPTSEEGKNRKLGAIPLRATKNIEKQLLDWLKDNPENLQKLANKLLLDFQLAEAGEKVQLALD